MSLATLITAILEAALNRYLALDPRGMEKLQALQGHVIGIELQGLGITLYVQPGRTHLQVLSRFDGEVDTFIRGAPLSLLRMQSVRHREDTLFAGDVTVEGDVEIGQQFQAILRQLDIDWEEHLSHITGDVIAHQVGRGLRELRKWMGESGDSLRQDIAEYLQEEAQLTIHRWEMADFSLAVDTLRNDAERLSARIQRLKTRAHNQQQHP